MSRLESYFAHRGAVASVERFLLAQLERQMTRDARGYMGDHWAGAEAPALDDEGEE